MKIIFFEFEEGLGG